MSTPSLALVGTGAVARAIGRAHVDAGGRVICVRSRAPERAELLARRLGTTAALGDADLRGAQVVIVAVSDRAVPEVGRRLLGGDCCEGALLLHTSGALSGSALGDEPLRVGSLHPLRSFPPSSLDRGDDGGSLVPGTHWFHEGAGEEVARALVAAWGGEFHGLAPGAKALYHAAAAIVSNHTVALFDAATQLFAAAGIDASDARAPLGVLLAGTAANLAEKGAPGALTGPVARGDVETVTRHVAVLRLAAPHLVASYVEVALLAVDLAVRRGSVDTLTAGRLRRALSA